MTTSANSVKHMELLKDGATPRVVPSNWLGMLLWHKAENGHVAHAKQVLVVLWLICNGWLGRAGSDL